MNIKGKYVILGIVLLLGAWLGNIYCYQRHLLKEPVFLKHYYEIPYGVNSFTLFYIENLNHMEKVQYIEFPEINAGFPVTNGYADSTDTLYYNLRSIRIEISPNREVAPPDLFKNKVITRARVWYEGGRNREITIGEIHLYRDEIYKDINKYSNSAVHNNTGIINFKRKQDFKIVEINNYYEDILRDNLKISIGKYAIEEIKLPYQIYGYKGLSINYCFVFNKDDMDKYNVYDFPVNIVVEDEKNNRSIERMPILYFPRIFEDFSVEELLKERGE